MEKSSDTPKKSDSAKADPKTTNQRAPEKDVKDDEFEKALKEPDKTPAPTEKDLDKMDPEGSNADTSDETTDESPSTDPKEPLATAKPEKTKKKVTEAELVSLRKASNLLDAMPEDTGDNFNLYGYSGIRFTLGDLKNLVDVAIR